MAGSAFETVATAVKAIFEAEFLAEGLTMIPDRLHESLGRYRVDVGISPIDEGPTMRDRLVQETFCEIQFYDLWTDEISPDTQVNPFKITAYAERLRDALRRARATDPGTGQVWFFDVDRTTYQNDPTGNKTRFHMRIRAFGNNSDLIETTD